MMAENTMFTEDELLPLSALQHMVFCERQCALIHVEGQWKDNPLTIEGSHLHRRVDEEAPRREVRGDLVILRGLALRSLRMGLVGRADVVELHRRDPGVSNAVPVQGLGGQWLPYPVDYKRGKPKDDRCDDVQLCAQALCLEEMLDVHVPEGALFYGRQQRRHVVPFDQELRRNTEDVARRLRELVNSGKTPRAEKTAKCKKCSLLAICMPEAMRRGCSARRYLHTTLSDVLNEADE
jgi:CRISPR-associated exonuclease Cas4